jgi:hypothetical protein
MHHHDGWWWHSCVQRAWKDDESKKKMQRFLHLVQQPEGRKGQNPTIYAFFGCFFGVWELWWDLWHVVNSDFSQHQTPDADADCAKSFDIFGHKRITTISERQICITTIFYGRHFLTENGQFACSNLLNYHFFLMTTACLVLFTMETCVLDYGFCCSYNTWTWQVQKVQNVRNGSYAFIPLKNGSYAFISSHFRDESCAPKNGILTTKNYFGKTR